MISTRTLRSLPVPEDTQRVSQSLAVAVTVRDPPNSPQTHRKLTANSLHVRVGGLRFFVALLTNLWVDQAA